MKKNPTLFYILILVFTCTFFIGTSCQAITQTDPFEWFTRETSYGGHNNGTFGGMTRISEDSVRILAGLSTDTSKKHIGFCINKRTIQNIVDGGYNIMSFRITTESYESNPAPGYVDVYASNIDASIYQLSIDDGIREEKAAEDIYYPSGSVIEVDLVKLLNASGFRDGLKFVLLKGPDFFSAAAGAPAYLVLSDFQFTKGDPFEQMLLESSYANHTNGEFGGVAAVDEDSVKILAKEKNGLSGFMLTKNAVESLLMLDVNEITVTLRPSSYNSGPRPEYVVLESPAPLDYVVNYKSEASIIDGNKLYFEPGSRIIIRLDKLYADITAENSLKFTLLSGYSWEYGGTTAYLTLDNMVFAKKWESRKYKLVGPNGDFDKEFSGSWSSITEQSIRKVAEAGFEYIDLSLYRVKSDSDIMKTNWQYIVRDLKNLADELGIEFRQAHSPGTFASNTKDWIDRQKRAIDVCQMLGIKNIIVHSAETLDNANTKEEFYKINAECYGQILPYAKVRGINILCENGTSTKWYINDGASMREFIKYIQRETGCSNFHGCWDTGHANWLYDSQYLDIIALGDEMYGIHFHDNMGTGDNHMIPYYGNLDIDGVMRALRMIGYNGDFTLETDGRPRITSTYAGPELKDGLNPYTTDRTQQQRIVYQIATYILDKYDCGEDKLLFEEGSAGYINLRAKTDISDVSIFVASYAGKKLTNAVHIPKSFTKDNLVASIPVKSGDKVFVWNSEMKPLTNVYTVE